MNPRRPASAGRLGLLGRGLLDHGAVRVGFGFRCRLGDGGAVGALLVGVSLDCAALCGAVRSVSSGLSGTNWNYAIAPDDGNVLPGNW